LVAGRGHDPANLLIIARSWDARYGKIGNYAQEEETKEVSSGRNRESDGTGANWDTEGIASGSRPEEEGPKAQADAGEAAGRGLAMR
jgi:hypothetical protein